MENNTDKSASEILLEAAALLTEEGSWSKGSLFALNPSPLGCSMCAHGAIAYCGNPKIKQLINSNAIRNMILATEQARVAARSGYWANHYFRDAEKEQLALPEYIVKHYGQTGLAHYKASMVGLVMSYNDMYETTKQDVINKLREAAIL